jgi:hypothetical protein
MALFMRRVRTTHEGNRRPLGQVKRQEFQVMRDPLGNVPVGLLGVCSRFHPLMFAIDLG